MLEAFKKGFGATVGIFCGCIVLSIVSELLKERTKKDEPEKETEEQKTEEESQ